MSFLRGIYNTIIFSVERFVVRGAFYQLLIIAAAIVLISLFAGLLAYNQSQTQFPGFFHAVWWAFLRLTDPGYLGDDNGTYIRVISTILTILGYVLFLGSLVAILTQGLNRFISKLESGLTNISDKNHIVILNLTHRTPLILKALLLSRERVGQFLKSKRIRKLKIVILSETVNMKIIHDLRSELGPLWDDRKIIMRSGNPLEIEHLKRINILDAAAVIYPGSDLKEDRIYHDSKVFKILFTLSSFAKANRKSPPQFITEINEHSNLELIEETGLKLVDALSTTSIISRIIVQNIRHRYLSFIYNELLNQSTGNQIHTREAEEFIGLKVSQLALSFPKAIFLGVYRNNEAILNPEADLMIEENDRCIFMATSATDTYTFVPRDYIQLTTKEHRNQTSDVSGQTNVLILGWSYKCVEIINEFNSYPSENFNIDFLSAVPSSERIKAINTKVSDLEHLKIHHFDSDYSALNIGQMVDLKKYDNILLIANDWLDTDEQADARTLHGYLRLISTLKKLNHKCDILVELMNSDNEKNFPKKMGEFLVSPVIVTHILAHMTLKPELNEVFDEIFGPFGTEIKFLPPTDFGFIGKTNFTNIQNLALSRQSIAIGVVKGSVDVINIMPQIYLNPDRRVEFEMSDDDRIIILDHN